jgi:hypothetical protein
LLGGHELTDPVEGLGICTEHGPVGPVDEIAVLFPYPTEMELGRRDQDDTVAFGVRFES